MKFSASTDDDAAYITLFSYTLEKWKSHFTKIEMLEHHDRHSIITRQKKTGVYKDKKVKDSTWWEIKTCSGNGSQAWMDSLLQFTMK